MPLPAPVTIATLPSSCISVLAPSLSLDDEVGDEPRPAGLVGGAQPGTAVAVEVLVEEDQVVPGRLLLQHPVGAEDGPSPRLVLEEEAGQAIRQGVRDLGQRRLPAGAGRKLDAE